MGLPLLVFSLVSLVGTIPFIRRAPYLIVFYVYTLAFSWHLAYYAQVYGRYGILLIPSLLFFSIFILNQIYLKVRYFWIPFILIVGLGSVPFYQSALLGTVLEVPDTRNLAKEWFLKNADSGSKVLLDNDRYQPRLPFCKEDLYEALKTVDPGSAQAKRIHTLMKIQGAGPCFHVYYAIEETLPYRKVYGLSGKRIPQRKEKLKEEKIRYYGLTYVPGEMPSEEWLDFLNRKGKRVARFSPFKEKERLISSDKIDLTGAPTMLKDLKERRRNGYLIEIYELKL